MEQVHEKTKTGFIDGQDYEKNRPSYTDEVVKITAEIIQEETTPGTNYKYDCLELGAGTGKFTQKIHPVLSKDVRYLATEPMPGFLETLMKKCPGVETMQCIANQIPLPDQCVKTVVAAQCFHWFATEEALSEIHRVLVNGGKFVMLWNHKLKESSWSKGLDQILTDNYGDTPRASNYTWKTVMDASPKFSYVRHDKLGGVYWKGTREEIVNHFGSISVISAMDEVQKPEVLQQFRDVLDRHFDESVKEIEMPFETELCVCSKV